MTTIINASNGSTSGLITTADASGVLQLQTNNGTPALTLNTTQALGVGSSPAYGTSGQVLTSAGTSASPTWTTPSSGAMSLISTQTASSSASLSWTGLSSYDKYILIYENICSNGNLILTIGYGATPTYITSGYLTQLMYCIQTQSAPVNATPTSSSVPLTAYAYGYLNSTPPGASGNCYILNANSTSYKYFEFQSISNTPNGKEYNTGGSANSTPSAMTAIQINCSGSTFTGTASLYGITS